MSLSTMQDKLLAKLGMPSGSMSAQVKTHLALHINDVQRNLSKKAKWRRLGASGTITTVAGTDTYALVSGVIKEHGLVEVRNSTNNVPLYPMPDDEWRSGRVASESGSPGWYRSWGVGSGNVMQIQLKPNPDAVYTIYYEYYAFPSDLTALADTTPFDEELLELGALAQYLRYDRDPHWESVDEDFRELLNSEKALNNGMGQKFRFGSSENRDSSRDFPRIPYPYNTR